MTIEEAEKIVHDLGKACLCLPSTSHTEEAHRFRLIFPTLSTIRNEDIYRATYSKYAEFFNVDPACKDLARFYFGSTMEDGFFVEAALLEPVRPPQKPRNSPRFDYDSTERVAVGESIEELVTALYGEPRETVPENVAYWLENAPTGLIGEWNNVCNAALFTLGLMGCDQDIVEEVFRTIAPDELDQHDEYLLDRAWNEGYDAREESKEDNN